MREWRVGDVVLAAPDARGEPFWQDYVLGVISSENVVDKTMDARYEQTPWQPKKSDAQIHKTAHKIGTWTLDADTYFEVNVNANISEIVQVLGLPSTPNAEEAEHCSQLIEDAPARARELLLRSVVTKSKRQRTVIDVTNAGAASEPPSLGAVVNRQLCTRLYEVKEELVDTQEYTGPVVSQNGIYYEEIEELRKLAIEHGVDRSVIDEIKERYKRKLAESNRASPPAEKTMALPPPAPAPAPPPAPAMTPAVAPNSPDTALIASPVVAPGTTSPARVRVDFNARIERALGAYQKDGAVVDTVRRLVSEPPEEELTREQGKARDRLKISAPEWMTRELDQAIDVFNLYLLVENRPMFGGHGEWSLVGCAYGQQLSMVLNKYNGPGTVNRKSPPTRLSESHLGVERAILQWVTRWRLSQTSPLGSSSAAASSSNDPLSPVPAAAPSSIHVLPIHPRAPGGRHANLKESGRVLQASTAQALRDQLMAVSLAEHKGEMVTAQYKTRVAVRADDSDIGTWFLQLRPQEGPLTGGCFFAWLRFTPEFPDVAPHFGMLTPLFLFSAASTGTMGTANVCLEHTYVHTKSSKNEWKDTWETRMESGMVQWLHILAAAIDAASCRPGELAHLRVTDGKEARASGTANTIDMSSEELAAACQHDVLACRQHNATPELAAVAQLFEV